MTHAPLSNIQLSPLDTARFGVTSARVSDLTLTNLAHANAFCAENQVQFLIARVDIQQLPLVHQLETQGFLLMDTLVYYRRDLKHAPIPLFPSRAVIRPATPQDQAGVEQVAAQAFTNYDGHYHADARLPRALCDDVYRSWAQRTISTAGVADQVLVADVDGEVVGFAALKFNVSASGQADEGEGLLYAIAPKWQGQGIYTDLFAKTLDWFLANGASHFIISTQITNIAVQKVWARCGLAFHRGFYTFHKWFDA